jgi:hypothetical protein
VSGPDLAQAAALFAAGEASAALQHAVQSVVIRWLPVIVQ